MKIKITFFLLFVSLFPVYGEEQFVYHASPIKGLKELIPRISTHGKNWVYATKYIGIVAAYLGKWTDFDLAQGSCGDGTKIHLVERYKDAFKEIYGSSKGSIYKLNSTGFLENMTGFSREVVNPSKVAVVEEIVVDFPLEYLKSLSEKGELELFYYPNRPSCIPKDDSDLAKKAVRWIKEGKPRTKDSLLKKHPDLAERLDAALKHEQASITITRGQKLLE